MSAWATPTETPRPRRGRRASARLASELSPAKARFALALATRTTNVSKAAKALGIGRTSWYKWASDPAVQAYAASLRGEADATARRLLASLVPAALVVLEELLESDDARIRLRAACAILDRAGLSKEAALTWSAPGAGYSAVQVNYTGPAGPDALDARAKHAAGGNASGGAPVT